jgi:hypothetical protein
VANEKSKDRSEFKLWILHFGRLQTTWNGRPQRVIASLESEEA